MGRELGLPKGGGGHASWRFSRLLLSSPIIQMVDPVKPFQMILRPLPPVLSSQNSIGREYLFMMASFMPLGERSPL
jgi:hypothetical protein